MNIATCIVSVFAKLGAIFRQLLCFLHIKRNRKNSGSLLPLHADMQPLAAGEVMTSLPSNDRHRKNSGTFLPLHTVNTDVQPPVSGDASASLQNNDMTWDSWGEEVSLNAPDGGNYHSQQQQRQVNSSNDSPFGSRYVKKQPDPIPEPETDYFQELKLEPAIRRTQKVLIRKTEDNYTSGPSRLKMMSDIPIVSGELGLMEDSTSGWADEAGEDLSGEALSAIRETRRMERAGKIAENQQKKFEKGASSARSMRKDKFSAVKLS